MVKQMKAMVTAMTLHLQPDDIPIYTVLSMKASTYQRWKHLRAELELEVGSNMLGLFLNSFW